MYQLFLLLAVFVGLSFTSQAQGVGSPLEEVLKDDFASFFNIKEQKSTPTDLGQKSLHYKTGGFQEYLDLQFTVDKNKVLVAAELTVDYKFIKEQSTFAIDVIKSFLQDFCAEQDEEVCATLATRLWKGEGEVAPELAGVMQLLGNQKKWDCTTLSACVLNTEMRKEGLAFSFHAINWEQQAIPEQHFLNQKDLKKYHLELTQEEPTFKIWMPEKTDKSQFSRLVDGHWHFQTAEAALNYYKAYQLQQSEGMALVEDFDKKLGEEVWVYETGPAQQEMMAALGLETTEEFYCFWMRKGASINKIFVVVEAEGGLELASQLAQRAVEKL